MNGQRNGNSQMVVPLWLDGCEVDGEHTLDVISPVTGKVCHRAAATSEADAEKAIHSCRKAFRTWSQTKPSIRRDIFLQAASEFGKRKEELWEILHAETGVDRQFFEVTFAGAVDMCKDVAGRIASINGKVPVIQEEGSSAIVFREPYGVVIGIAPWNAPLVLGLRACIQPLACGNTVILKGSELSPRIFWAIASILHASGLPAGCLNTICHRSGEDAIRVTNYLVASPHVRKLSFTGSTAVGSSIARTAGQYLKPVVMELGGKASAIVCEDADIEAAAQACVLGAFSNSGQICMSTERILVQKNISAQFQAAFSAAADAIFPRQGQPLYLVTETAVQKNLKLVKDALAGGAQMVLGSKDDPSANGFSMHPVAISSVTKEMDIFYSESFGPSVSILEFDNDIEAVEIANDTEYGLTAAVFTGDLQRGLRIAKMLDTGAVHINSMTPHDESVLPHGGFKKSGWGRFNAEEGLNEWLQTKSVTWKD